MYWHIEIRLAAGGRFKHNLIKIGTANKVALQPSDKFRIVGFARCNPDETLDQIGVQCRLVKGGYTKDITWAGDKM